MPCAVTHRPWWLLNPGLFLFPLSSWKLEWLWAEAYFQVPRSSWHHVGWEDSTRPYHTHTPVADRFWASVYLTSAAAAAAAAAFRLLGKGYNACSDVAISQTCCQGNQAVVSWPRFTDAKLAARFDTKSTVHCRYTVWSGFRTTINTCIRYFYFLVSKIKTLWCQTAFINSTSPKKWHHSKFRPVWYRHGVDAFVVVNILCWAKEQ